MEKILCTGNSNYEVGFKLSTSRDYDNKILKTLNKIFGHVTLSKKWYEWFTYQSPQGVCLWFIGEDRNDIVCTYGFLPTQIMIHGKLWNSVLAVNTGVIPSYWGKGTYQKFSKFSLDTIFNKLNRKLVIAIPNNVGYIAHLRLGWTDLGKFIFVNLSRNRISDRVYENNVKKIDFGDIPEKLNDFIEEISSKYELFVMKDINLIKWRYSRPDYKDSYRFGLLKSKEDMYGYVIIKVYEDVEENKKKIHIMDINYRDRNSFVELIGFACKIANEEKADIVNTWVYMDSKPCDDFFKIGFEKSNIERHFIVCSKDIKMKKTVKKATNIHLTLGDNDVY